MKITRDDDEQLILQHTWFDKYNDHAIFLVLIVLGGPTFYLINWNELMVFPLFLIYTICIIILIGGPLSYVIIFREFLVINFKEEIIRVEKRVFRKYRETVKLPINEIVSLSNWNTYSRYAGGDFKIYAELKKELVDYQNLSLSYLDYDKNFIVSTHHISIKTENYFNYFYDLLNILLVNHINSKGYMIKPILSTTISKHQPDLTFSNLKDYTKKYYREGKYSVDFVLGVFLFIVGILLFVDVFILISLI